MATRNKMYWWARLWRKLFGKHPNVYVTEEILSVPVKPTTISSILNQEI